VSLKYDRDILAWFAERFSGYGYKLPDLLREMALSRAFSQVRPAEATVETVVSATDASPSQITRNRQ
jgi:hypothetical protein